VALSPTKFQSTLNRQELNLRQPAFEMRRGADYRCNEAITLFL
jgi:hypothetical protein